MTLYNASSLGRNLVPKRFTHFSMLHATLKSGDEAILAGLPMKANSILTSMHLALIASCHTAANGTEISIIAGLRHNSLAYALCTAMKPLSLLRCHVVPFPLMEVKSENETNNNYH